MEDEQEDIVQRLQELRLWQEQLNGDNSIEDAGILSEEQFEMMKGLGLNGGWKPEDCEENLSEHEDDQFFNDLQQRIDAIRSGSVSIDEINTMGTNNVKRPLTSKSLDETPVHGMKNMDFATTPLKTIDLNQISVSSELTPNEENEEQSKRFVVRRPFLKKGEGLTTRFKVPPETFNLKNLPKYKYADRNAMSLEQKLPNRNQNKKEIRKNNSCPRLETSYRSNRIARRLALGSKENERKQIPRSKTAPCVSKLTVKGEAKEVLKRGPTVNTSSNHVIGAWASALGSTSEDRSESPHFKILDISHEDEHHRKELEELKSFEHNEKRTQNSLPMPSITKQIEIESALSGSDTEEDNESRPYNHVQFSSHVEGIEPLETDAETVMSETNDFDFSKTSTPHDKLGFAQFKAKLLHGVVEPLSIQSVEEAEKDELINGTLKDDTLIEQRKEFANRNQLLQSHLRQLEKEIQTYQRENAVLIKMKQSHEMEKIRLEQDRDEMEAKLNDERIRMEVYFHDERMKIKEKQDQLDRRIKETHKPTRKERDEVMKLNERIAQLEAESKAKEVKHGSAQARLRAQVRQLEKQVQEQKLEIDVLKRDNKRVETENVRLRRENNSKMLVEINKNIAKLASNPSAPASTEAPPHTKTAPKQNKLLKSTTVAKVVSHFPHKTDNKKLSKSLTVSKKSVNGSYTESEPDHDTSFSEDDQMNNNKMQRYSSAYFKGTNGKRKSSPISDSVKSSPIDNHTSPVPTSDLRKEKLNPDGSKDTYYPNGNLKKISADGMVIKLFYFNKDIKETNLHDGTIKYYYASNNSWETVFTDGRQVLEFADGQIEHRNRDGRIEVHFPNGAKRIVDPSMKDIQESWVYPDGTKVDVYNNDDKILFLPNGQREIHTKDHKRREFPDGSVKIQYNDGTQETRYSNGRIRKRDKDGNLTLDTGAINP